MKQEDKDLLLRDLCSRLPYGVKVKYENEIFDVECVCPMYEEVKLDIPETWTIGGVSEVKPYLFPMSSMTDEDHTIYSKIWEDTGKTAYLEGCHHLISTIKAYKAANDYLLSKHYDINGLIPMGLAIDATDKNIY